MPATIYVADEAYSIYRSIDSGASWQHTATIDSVNSDALGARQMTMAVNDGDYATLCVADSTPSPSVYPTFDNAVSVGTFASISTSIKQVLTDADTGPGGICTNIAIGGSGSQTMLATVYERAGFGTPTSSLPGLSTNRGISWTQLPGPGDGTSTTRACCMGRNAIPLYVYWWSDLSTTNIYSSVDAGTTWSAASDFSTLVLDSDAIGSIACSQDGSVIVFATNTDSTPTGATVFTYDGAAWHTTNLASAPYNFRRWDANWTSYTAMATDGSAILVTGNTDTGGTAIISTDKGVSWKILNPPSAAGNQLDAGAMSPEGQGILLVYDAQSGPTAFVDISTDQGATWTTSTITLVPNASGGLAGLWVGANIFSRTTTSFCSFIG